MGLKGLPEGLVEIVILGIWSEANPGPKGPTDKVQLWSEPGKFGPKGLPQGLVEIVRSNEY